MVAEQCDMRFLKIDVETKLNVCRGSLLFYRVYSFRFSFTFQNIDCWYALQSPKGGDGLDICYIGAQCLSMYLL